MIMQLWNLFTALLKESLFKTPIMTILNKLVWISLITLNPITIQNGFTLLWAGAVLCSLKYKILKSLTSCPVFLDLSNILFKSLSNFLGAVHICRIFLFINLFRYQQYFEISMQVEFSRRCGHGTILKYCLYVPENSSLRCNENLYLSIWMIGDSSRR